MCKIGLGRKKLQRFMKTVIRNLVFYYMEPLLMIMYVYLHIYLLFFSHQVMSDSLQPHELHHTRFPCLSLSGSLLKLMSMELMILSNHLILLHPLLLLPSIFPSIGVFSNELALRIKWPKYWSFNISPSNEYSGLISLRIGLP